jgi:AcrR family transcriptional regulator
MLSGNERGGSQSVRLVAGGDGVSEAGYERIAEIQRSRLVAATVELVNERGLVDATVARIVALAGVSRRKFYELFDDREDCLLAAFDEGLAQASRYVLDAYDPKAGWAGRVREALMGVLCFLDERRGVGQLLIVGSLGAGAPVIERRRQVLDRMIAFVEEGRVRAKAGAELTRLTAEGVVGGALSVIHARMVASPTDRLVELVNPLTSMIVLPYLGPAAARRELERPLPKQRARDRLVVGDPLRDLGMRLTYRTMRVLLSVAAAPGA